MRIPTLAFPLTVLLLAATAHAGSNTNYLVPAYQPCAAEVNNCPAVLESTFTFESARFKAASSPYLKDDHLAIAVELKGVATRRERSSPPIRTPPTTIFG